MASIVKQKRNDGKVAYRIHYKDHQGKRRSKIILGNRKHAESIAHRLELEIQDIKAGIKRAPLQRVQLGIMVQKYLEHCRRTNLANNTVIRYQTSMNVFQDMLGASKPVGQITQRDIEAFKTARAEDCTPNGVNIDLRHVRAFLNHCVKQDVISRSPFRGVKLMKLPPKDVRFLTPDELKNLMKKVNQADDQRVKDLILFYLHTGARATEILPPNLIWDNITETTVTLIGKGRKERTLALNETMKNILEAHKDFEYPFPYEYDRIYDWIVRKYYNRAGIKNANVHTLRKTAGALLIQQGVDIYRVSRFLGHTSVTVTERHYANLLEHEFEDMSTALDNATSEINEPESPIWKVAS